MEINNYNDYIDFLKSNINSNKSEFDKKLISTKYEILGLKLPFLRKFAKEIVKNGKAKIILSNKNFSYYEEILVFGFVLSQFKIGEEERINKIKNYISIFDNWSVVDSFCSSLKVVNKNKDLYLEFIKFCLNSSNDFEIRFGIVLLMDYFLSEENLSEILNLAISSQKDSYYIQMALSWLLATSFAKNFDKTYSFFSFNKKNLSEFVRRKTISKCNDSFRISAENKCKIKDLLS